jgi:nucleoside-diphosphate-sugar epimerase
VKVAITGASGFIGRYVLEELLSQGYEIIATTRNVNNLATWKSKIEIVETDLNEVASQQLERLAQVDVLLHLAWDGLPNFKSKSHFEDQLPKQYEFLKKLIERGLGNLFLAGTCLEYGMQSGPLSENDPALPLTAYGFAKDTLRRQLEFLGRDLSFSMTWGRLFYTYGDAQSPTSLYSQFKAELSRASKVFDMSAGEQLRDYLPVVEVARLIVYLAMRCENLGVTNICSGKPISVRRLVEQWIVENGAEMQLNLGKYPYPDYEPLAFWGYRSKLDRILALGCDS